ncbi:MAG: hypothetical protein HYY23_06220, partial [Verrucomicrobia bacterium]|nr:hypothetical protein [Verrucomicrobiota bacterium]
LERLQRAAEVYSVTEFESYLAEMEACGEAATRMAASLREMSRNVQFDDILKALELVRTRS